MYKGEVEPMLAPLAVKVQEQIIQKILEKYPDKYILKIGSVGKKRDDMYNNDIDIAIKCESIDELRSLAYDVFGEENVTSVWSFYMMSVKYAYEIEYDDSIQTGTTVCDLILMKDVAYTMFRYDAPYLNESKYKTGMKIMFVHILLNYCDKELNEGIDDDHYAKFDFTPIGLYRYICNKNDIKDWKKEFVTSDVHKIMNMIFYDPNIEDFHTIESLWKLIHSDKFKYKDSVKSFEITWFIETYRKGWYSIKPEDFKLDYFTVDEINEILDNYRLEHLINMMLYNGIET